MDLLVILVLLALVVLFVSAPLRRAPDPAAAARAEEGEASQVVELEATGAGADRFKVVYAEGERA